MRQPMLLKAILPNMGADDALHIKAIEIVAFGDATRGAVAGEKEAAEAMALGQYVAGMGVFQCGAGTGAWGWRIR